MRADLKITILLIAALAVVTCGCGLTGTTGVRSGESDTAVQALDSTRLTETKASNVDTVTIAITGDIMTGTTYPRSWLPPDNGKDVFSHTRNILRSADVACGNLEGVLADSGRARKGNRPGTFSFLIPSRDINLLVDAGYDFLGIANNHINDFYEDGMLKTIKAVKDAGLGVAGTSDTEYSIRELAGVKYGFCAFGFKPYTLCTDDTATVRRIITALRPQVDILIVCFHAGCEGNDKRHLPYQREFHAGQTRGFSREFAHFSIDCGADLVYGHGPHVCRAVELYKDRFIAYSLGNFATPTGMRLERERGYAPIITVRLAPDGSMVDAKIHSFVQYRYQGPRRDSLNTVVKEIRNLTREDIKDNKLTIADDGTIARNATATKQ